METRRLYAAAHDSKFIVAEPESIARFIIARLALNPGLIAADFDTANPDYGFSRWRLRLPRV